MKFVLLALLTIVIVVCLALATEFDEFDENEEYPHYAHDEDVHDFEDESEGNSFLNEAASGFSSMTREEVNNHFKDIIRGFSDRGFEDCDNDGDGFLGVDEVECFIVEKMGFSVKTTAGYVVHHYDRDENGKLDKDEIWIIVEDKDTAIFKILPSTMEKNMLLMHGLQQDHIEAN
ncbi:unnamed protein product [Caenorhabditis sp. 36 PRJEB53466]|nr:unnamed protein product [Caenorhabditis sp. 36 PRJEB53466]